MISFVGVNTRIKCGHEIAEISFPISQYILLAYGLQLYLKLRLSYGAIKAEIVKGKRGLYYGLEQSLQCSRFKRTGGNNVVTKALHVWTLEYACCYTVHLCPEVHVQHVLRCMLNFGKRHQVYP